MRAQPLQVESREGQVVFDAKIKDCLEADGSIKMTMEFRQGKIF
jgi:hypothetical protein